MKIKIKDLKKSYKIIILISFSAILLLTTFVITDSFAFFKYEDVMVNKLKVGDIKVKIEEEFNPPSDLGTEPITKVVKIKNPINTPNLIRVSITGRWINPNDEHEVIPNDGEVVKLNFSEEFDESGNSTNWYRADDGYYYYKKILNGNESTENLLDSVTFNISEDSIYRDKEYHVEVKAEAVQPTKHKDGNNDIYVYREVWRNISNKANELLKSIVDQYDKN